MGGVNINSRNVTKDLFDVIICIRRDTGKSLSIEDVIREEPEAWSLREAAKKYYGGWAEALLANYARPPEYKPLSVDGIATELYRLKCKGIELTISNFDNRLKYSISKRFGGWKSAKRVLEITNTFKDYEKLRNIAKIEDVDFIIYSEVELFEIVTQIMKVSERITNEVLAEHDGNILPNIRSKYGTLNNYFSRIGIDLCKSPYVPFKWDAVNLRRQLLRWIREGVPVNYTSVASRNYSIIEACRKVYGSWEALFTECGLDYTAYRTDTKMASYYGTKFEGVVAEILDEIYGVDIVREPTINGCRPDFVLPGNVWVDAKLSKWTVHISDCVTVEKYEPHCSRLIILYLRDNGSNKSIVGSKTTLVNVREMVECLGKERRQYYNKVLTNIERELDDLPVLPTAI